MHVAAVEAGAGLQSKRSGQQFVGPGELRDRADRKRDEGGGQYAAEVEGTSAMEARASADEAGEAVAGISVSLPFIHPKTAQAAIRTYS